VACVDDTVETFDLFAEGEKSLPSTGLPNSLTMLPFRRKRVLFASESEVKWSKKLERVGTGMIHKTRRTQERKKKVLRVEGKTGKDTWLLDRFDLSPSLQAEKGQIQNE